MVGIDDFLKLIDRLNSAKDAESTAAARQALESAVAAEIAALFDDEAFPQRRRSFSVIRKRLGIFDESSAEYTEARLRQILFGMGARVHRGEGADALWELPENDTAKNNAGEGAAATAGRPVIGDTKRKWSIYRTGALAAIVGILLLAANGLVQAMTDRSLVQLIAGLFQPTQTRAECIENANGNFLEIRKCPKT